LKKCPEPKRHFSRPAQKRHPGQAQGVSQGGERSGTSQEPLTRTSGPYDCLLQAGKDNTRNFSRADVSYLEVVDCVISRKVRGFPGREGRGPNTGGKKNVMIIDMSFSIVVLISESDLARSSELHRLDVRKPERKRTTSP
jgi:hypothetical protein